MCPNSLLNTTCHTKNAEPAAIFESVQHSKAELRHKLLGLRRSLSRETSLELSSIIQKQVLALSAWSNAHTVALYIAVRQEVSTEYLLDAAWKENKTVLLPRCFPPVYGDGLMEFAICNSRDSLIPASFGIPEPAKDCPSSTILPDLIIVPAVGINRAGGRLGYGKGFYDRLLARTDWADIPRIALIYHFQVIDFPTDPQDMPMHICITEKDILCF